MDLYGRRIKLRYTFAFLFMFLSFGLLFGQDTTVVETEGVAGIGPDPAAARDRAIEDALRRAVEQAVGTIVESETTVENYELLSDRIFSRSSGYVKTYEILSENREGDLLRVKVSAVVSTGDLNNDLNAIGVLQKRMKYPRIMVMIAEDSILQADYWQSYSVSTSQSEETIISRLKSRGFRIVDPMEMRRQISANEARAAWQGGNDIAGRMGSRLGAEIVIVGQAISNRAASNIYGSDLLSMSTSLTARAVKAGTSEVIASASAQGTAAHINEVAALQQSLQKASEKAAEDLASGILETWKQETSGDRSLAIVIHDISPAELKQVKDAFQRLRGVTDVMERSFSNGLADLDVRAKTDALELSSVIAKTSFQGFRLVLQESSADRLEYRVVD